MKVNLDLYKEAVGHPKYLVSKFGTVHERSNLTMLSQLNRNGYFNVKLEVGVSPSRFSRRMNERGKMRVIQGMKKFQSFPVHRLVAEAWIREAKEGEVVNHINGFRNDNRSDNLEWVTSGENNLHSRNINPQEFGEKDEQLCYVRDFTDGKVHVFDTVNEAKHFMGMPINVLTVQLNPIRYGVLLNERYEFRLGTDKRPWFYEKRTKKVEARYLVTCLYPDGKEIEIFNVKDWRDNFDRLPKCEKTPFKQLYYMAIKRYPDIKFSFRDSFDEDPYVKLRTYRRVPRRDVWVFDIETMETTVFENSTEAAEFLGTYAKRVTSLLGNPTIYKGRYLLCRDTDEKTKEDLLKLHTNGSPNLSNCGN